MLFTLEPPPAAPAPPGVRCPFCSLPGFEGDTGSCAELSPAQAELSGLAEPCRVSSAGARISSRTLGTSVCVTVKAPCCQLHLGETAQHHSTKTSNNSWVFILPCCVCAAGVAAPTPQPCSEVSCSLTCQVGTHFIHFLHLQREIKPAGFVSKHQRVLSEELKIS